jgi:hypothetical protein
VVGSRYNEVYNNYGEVSRAIEKKYVGGNGQNQSYITPRSIQIKD